MAISLDLQVRRGEALTPLRFVGGWQSSHASLTARMRTGWHAFALFVLGVFWGLQFTLLKIATVARFDEIGILTVSMVLLACLYLGVLVVGKLCFRPRVRHLRFFFSSSALGFVLPLTAVIFAARHISAGMIVLFESMTPVLTVVIALGFRTERVTRARLISVAIGVLAVAVVLWPELATAGEARAWSLLIALFIPLIFALDGIYVAARWPSDLRAIQVVAGESIAAALLAIPLFLLFGEGISLAGQWHAGHWAIIGFVLVTFVEGYLYFHLIKTMGAVFVSFASIISLIAGVVWGMTLLSETHSASVWCAVALCALALYFIVGRDDSGSNASANSARPRLGNSTRSLPAPT